MKTIRCCGTLQKHLIPQVNRIIGARRCYHDWTCRDNLRQSQARMCQSSNCWASTGCRSGSFVLLSIPNVILPGMKHYNNIQQLSVQRPATRDGYIKYRQTLNEWFRKHKTTTPCWHNLCVPWFISKLNSFNHSYMFLFLFGDLTCTHLCSDTLV